MALDTAAALSKLRSLTVGFDNAVKATMPFYPRLCTIVPSDGYDEEYGVLGSVPQVREWLGDRQFKDLRGAKFTIVNKEWESSLLIKKTDIRDNRLGMYRPVMQNLGARAARHPDKLLLSDLVVNGVSNACLDGQFMFDTDHSWGDSGTQDNDLTTAIVDKSDPTVDEFRAAAVTALQQMLLFKDDQGELLHDDAVMGTNGGMELLALVPLNMWEVARKAFTPGLFINSGEQNVPIVIADVVPTPHFGADGDYWDLYRTDTPVKPYIFQAREPLTRQMKDVNDIETKDVKFMTSSRYNIGYGGWWNAVRTTFTTT